MPTPTPKIVFIVSHIPESSARNGARRAAFLADRFETLIVTKNQPDLPRSLSNAKHINLVGLRRIFMFPFIAYLRVFKGFNVIHCQYAINYIAIGYLAKKILGYVWVWDLWDHPLLPIQNNSKLLSAKVKLIAYERLLKRLLKSADVVLVFMQKNVLREFYSFSEDTSFVFGTNGYHVSTTSSDNPTTECDFTEKNIKPAERKLVIGYAGAIHENRGLKEIARLATDEEFKDQIELRLWGKGSDYVLKTLNDVAADVRSSLVYFGEIDHVRSIREIAEVDVCLCLLNLEILNYRYAYPVKLFEYMHGGKLVISTSTYATIEVAGDSKNIILVDSTYESLRDAVVVAKQLFESNELRSLGEIAKKNVSRYSWVQIEEQLEIDLGAALEEKLAAKALRNL